jgi:hypothetical protein
MWFDEPRIQLTFEKVMEKLNQIEPQYATGKKKSFSLFLLFSPVFR